MPGTQLTTNQHQQDHRSYAPGRDCRNRCAFVGNGVVIEVATRLIVNIAQIGNAVVITVIIDRKDVGTVTTGSNNC